MTLRGTLLLSVLLVMAPGSGEAAQSNRCEVLPITRDLLRSIHSSSTFRLAGHDAAVVGRREGGEGIVVFVRRNDRWRAYAGGDAQVQEEYANDRGDLFVWSYQGVEGPPPGYSGIHVPGGRGTPFCTYIRNPDELNKRSYNGEYLQFGSFNADNRGHARIRGTVTEIDGRTGQFHFEYRSRDGGMTWSRAVRTDIGATVTGIYRPASAVRSLRSEIRTQPR